MSNSIWKTPGFHEAIDNKLKVSKDGKWIYWTMYGWNIPGEDVHDIGVEWAYVEDVLTQADKAERLQEQLDIAIDTLKYIRDNDYGDPSGEAVDALTAIHKSNN